MTPYYADDLVTIYHGDMRDFPTVLASAVVTDPPYGVTSLEWDRWVPGWPAVLLPSVLWCFGTLRVFMERVGEFTAGRWKLSQDIVWEKQNGSGLFTDRFRRVHEQAALFYRGEWRDVWHDTQYTQDATARTIRRKTRPPHLGSGKAVPFSSVDGGPRLMRSVIRARSTHHYADNETQKPLDILTPLIEYSVAPGGSVYDPFAGAGSVLVAAKALGRQAIGVEIREDQCEIAARRCSQEVLGLVTA